MKKLSFTIILLLVKVILLSQPPKDYYKNTYTQGHQIEGKALKHELHKTIKNHKKYPYTHKTKTDVWDILKEADQSPTNDKKVILVYTLREQRKKTNSGEKKRYTGDRWNREHLWPKSHGFPKDTDTAYTDCHHIRAADESVNTFRRTRDFDSGGEQHDEAINCYYNDSLWTWEPPDEMKGDIARSIFYMVVRYDPGYHKDGTIYDLEIVDSTNTDPNNEGNPVIGKLSTLLQWHKADPVDQTEINRMEIIYQYQGNRNPFIDHPEFVEMIWE